MTNAERYLRVLVAPAQRFEAAMQAVLVGYRLDDAVGAQLNVLGKLVGQSRAGMDDDDYRRFIRARITANRSSGTIEEVLRVMELLIGDGAETIRVEEQYPASLEVHVESLVVDSALAPILVSFLRKVKAGGVRALLHTFPALEATSFAFFDEPDGLGLSSTAAPTTGGTFSTVQE